MITVGIDPGIERVGVGVIESNGSKLKLLHSQLIHTSSLLSVSERLMKIHKELEQILSIYPVENAAVEEIFFAKNIKTAITVAQARGVILLSLQMHGVLIFEYTPLQVKQAIIGYGRADKIQIQRMIRMILGDESITSQDDVADAIAMAITHIHSNKMLGKISR